MRRLTPYLLLTVLVLGTGLGIGLALSQATATEYPPLLSTVISAFNAQYKDSDVNSVPIHIEPMTHLSEAVSRDQAVDLVRQSCGNGQAKVLGVGTVEAWWNGPKPAPYWAVDLDPPGPHLLISAGRFTGHVAMPTGTLALSPPDG